MAHRFCPKPGNHPPHTLKYRAATVDSKHLDPWSRDYTLPPLMTAVCNGVRTSE